jgi:cytochrome b6-f complex iron-sulfur subunit
VQHQIEADPNSVLYTFHTALGTVHCSQHYTTVKRTMKFVSAILALCVASATAFAPAPVNVRHSAVVAPQMAAAEELYIDEERRFLMNLIVVGSAALTVGAIGIPYILFFVPPGSGGGAGGVPAKDALGNDIIAKEWLETHPANDRSLSQGLKGDAT